MFLLAFLFPLLSFAHGYWLDIKGTGKPGDSVRLQICFGEIDEYGIRHRETGPELASSGAFKLYVTDDKGKHSLLKLSPKTDCWEAFFIPSAKGTYRIEGINEELPVVDRSATGGENVRPIEYLCSVYYVESDTPVQKPDQYLDIVTARRDRLIVVKAFRNNLPAATGTKIRVFNPDNWEKLLSIDEHGEAVFMPVQKGLYIIRQDWNDAKPGSWQGKNYTGTRYRCNFCLWVP